MLRTARTAAVSVLIGVVALILGFGATPATADTLSDEARLLQLHNSERTSHGLAPLSIDPAATGVARAWAEELARSGNLRHNPNLVAAVDAHVTRDWTRLGENVGYSGTVDQVHTAYMNSPGHRANILGEFNRAGVGAARGADGRLWTTVVFVNGPALAPYAGLTLRCAPPTGDDTATHNAVSRLYRAYFLRDADQSGLDHWVPKYRSGELCLSDIADHFAVSPEFRSRYGSVDIPGFVRLVYVNVLGREPDPTGYTHWANQLAGGLPRGAMMTGFSESPEFRAVSNLP